MKNGGAEAASYNGIETVYNRGPHMLIYTIYD